MTNFLSENVKYMFTKMWPKERGKKTGESTKTQDTRINISLFLLSGLQIKESRLGIYKLGTGQKMRNDK